MRIDRQRDESRRLNDQEVHEFAFNSFKISGMKEVNKTLIKLAIRKIKKIALEKNKQSAFHNSFSRLHN
jgi:hypothetical protein